MSADSPNSRDSPPSPNRRRSSFVDMFSNRSAISPQSNPPRRLSITTLGLSTLPGTQTTPFSAIRARAESVSSANSNSVDESPFEDDIAPPPTTASSSGSPSVPQSPFARRMSFGAAKVMRDSRSGNAAANGRLPSVSSAASSSSNATPTSTNKSREGFDFAENLRARAERTSISGQSTNPMLGQTTHHRSKSVAEPPKPEMRKQQKVPDAFQERILKGDFYMD